MRRSRYEKRGLSRRPSKRPRHGSPASGPGSTRPNATAAGATATATTPDAKVLPVSARGLLWLGVGLSVFYLLLVAVTILAQPFLQDVSPIELMHRSNLWLGPLQGLAAGVLAAFFRSG